MACVPDPTCDLGSEVFHSRRQRTTSVNSPIISIIDDDPATRSALASLMRAKGFDAKAFDSAEDFLRSGAQETSRCIITDIQMPGLSGIELKRRLTDGKCNIPVIMITARAEERLHASAIESGAFCLLRKPFKSQVLLECLERALAG
jgi:FixJ family two-component response regulator